MRPSVSTDELRLLHVVTRNNARGAERVARELSLALSDLGWSQRIVALHPGHRDQGDLGLPVMGKHSVAAASRLRQEIQRGRPDVILAHGGAAARYSVLAAAGISVPVVWQRILEMPQAVWRSTVRRRLWAMVAARCAGVIALSDKAAREMTLLDYTGPVVTIPNHRPRVADIDLVPHPILAELQTRGLPIVGFVGHLVEQKDPLAAVKVAEGLLARHDDVHVIIAGDGPLRHALARAISSSTSRDRIHQLGHVDNVRGGVLPHLDALYITSRTESMTGVAVESVLAGCPVVAFDLDGLDVLLTETEAGAIVPLGDVTALVDQLLTILDDPSVGARMRRGAAANGDAFTTEKVANDYSKFLRRHVMSPRPPRAGQPEPRRVAHVMPNIGVGGAEQALAVLAATHDRTAWLPYVVTLHSPRRPIEETVISAIAATGTPVINLAVRGRADRSLLAWMSAAWRMRKLIRQENIDVVDSALFEADIVTRMAAVGLPVTHVTHVVNTTYEPVVGQETRSRGQWRLRVVRGVDRLTSRRTDAFVALTQAVSDSFRRQLGVGEERVHVVPRGVNLDRFPPLPVSPSPPRRLLTIGRLVPQKNHLRLIEAMTHTDDLSLTIVGEGPLHGELSALIDHLGLEHRVCLIGPTRGIQGLHESHDAFVMPSLWEGQSNALMEAMASARPLMVSDIDVFREVLGNTAVFVDPMDVQSIGAGLRRLSALSWRDRERLRSEVRWRAETQYSAVAATRALEKVYEAMVSTRR